MKKDLRTPPLPSQRRKLSAAGPSALSPADGTFRALLVSDTPARGSPDRPHRTGDEVQEGNPSATCAPSRGASVGLAAGSLRGDGSIGFVSWPQKHRRATGGGRGPAGTGHRHVDVTRTVARNIPRPAEGTGRASLCRARSSSFCLRSGPEERGWGVWFPRSFQVTCSWR